MEQLWAPWRLSYVACAKPPTEDDACFICRGLAEANDRDNLVALRRPKSVVVLNRFPYNNGHLHWHIVPRWNGDTNFMPVLSDTRVIVQSLDQLWTMLTENLKS